MMRMCLGSNICGKTIFKSFLDVVLAFEPILFPVKSSFICDLGRSIVNSEKTASGAA